MANIELDGGNKKIKVDSGDLTLDIPGDIILDADGGDVVFADGGTNLLKVTNSSSDVVFQPQVDTKDIVFKQYDGTVVATVEDNATFNVPTGKLAINGTAITSTAAEINLIDGGTARGTTAIADGDGVLINDAGTMRMTSVETLATYIGGGIASASQWRLTANFTGDASPVASNWEEVDTDGYGSIGSDMTQSSGIFTFPSTGVWWVTFDFMCFSDSQGATAYIDGEINTTTDNSSYAIAAQTRLNLAGNSYSMAAHASFIFDVTNTTTHKTRFDISTNAGTAVGATDVNRTYATFIRLGDT